MCEKLRNSDILRRREQALKEWNETLESFGEKPLPKREYGRSLVV